MGRPQFYPRVCCLICRRDLTVSGLKFHLLVHDELPLPRRELTPEEEVAKSLKLKGKGRPKGSRNKDPRRPHPRKGVTGLDSNETRRKKGLPNIGRVDSPETRKLKSVNNGMHRPEVREKQVKAFMAAGGPATSRPQRTLYSAYKMKFPSALMNAPIKLKPKTVGGKIRTVYADILIPDLNVVIEYDGEHHHKDVDKDRKRDEELLALGYTTIRVDKYTFDEAIRTKYVEVAPCPM